MSHPHALVLSGLDIQVGSKPVITGLDLTLKSGEILSLMGPNGSGKSSLSFALMGHPHYQVTSGTITLNGSSLMGKSPDQRAHLGLFLAFQSPLSIPGVSVQNALKTAYEAIHCSGCHLHEHCPKLSVSQFRQKLNLTAKTLNLDTAFLSRPLNDGFSGGEKKRVEMLTLLTLQPKVAILDEIDSGLDIDSLQLMAQAIQRAITSSKTSIILITHSRRILDHLKPDRVSVLVKGRLVQTGGPELIDHIEHEGYKSFV